MKRNKNIILKYSKFIIPFCLLFYFLSGCECLVFPPVETHKTTVMLNANGSICPINRIKSKGTMFVNENSVPVQGLTDSNISAILKWNIGGIKDSTAGIVNLTSANLSSYKLAISLTMDYSNSMFSGPYDTVTNKYFKILNMENGVKTFISFLGNNDIAEIIKFGDSVRVIQSFTSDKNLLYKAVDSLSQGWGGTALFMSMINGINNLSFITDTTYIRVLISFTDGENNIPPDPTLEDTVISKASLSCISIYTIGLLDAYKHSEPPGNHPHERTLVNIANYTGGYYYYAPNPNTISQIYNQINGQINNVYLIYILWNDTLLPLQGTKANLSIGVSYNSNYTSFSRPFIIP